MTLYKTIRIDKNGDAAQELEELKELLKKNRRYSAKDWTNADVIGVALDELYDKLNGEKIRGENQRKN